MQYLLSLTFVSPVLLALRLERLNDATMCLAPQFDLLDDIPGRNVTRPKSQDYFGL